MGTTSRVSFWLLLIPEFFRKLLLPFVVVVDVVFAPVRQSRRVWGFASSLLLFLLLPEWLSQQVFEALVLDRVLTLESAHVKLGSSAENSCATLLNNDSCLELGDKLAILLSKHWVWGEHVMVHAFTNSNLGAGLVADGSDGEWKGRESLVNLDKEGTSCLHLEVVDLLKLSLVDSATSLALLWLALASGHVDVQTDNITWLELKVSDVGRWSSPVDNAVVSINQVLLKLVGEDTLNSVATKLLSTLLNHFSDIGISSSLGNLALSGLERVPSSEDDVGLLASDLASSNDNSRGSVGGVSVNVSSANAVYKTRYVRFLIQ